MKMKKKKKKLLAKVKHKNYSS